MTDSERPSPLNERGSVRLGVFAFVVETSDGLCHAVLCQIAVAPVDNTLIDLKPNFQKVVTHKRKTKQSKQSQDSEPKCAGVSPFSQIKLSIQTLNSNSQR